MTALGRRQLELLALLGSPGRVMLTPRGRAGESLLTRGLVRGWPEPGNDGTRINPAGLRALADALEAGRLDAILDPRGAGRGMPPRSPAGKGGRKRKRPDAPADPAIHRRGAARK